MKVEKKRSTTPRHDLSPPKIRDVNFTLEPPVWISRPCSLKRTCSDKFGHQAVTENDLSRTNLTQRDHHKQSLVADPNPRPLSLQAKSNIACDQPIDSAVASSIFASRFPICFGC